MAIELDSRTHHLTDLAWRRDAERDRQLGLAGWLVLRYPWFVVVHRPGDVVSELCELLGK